MAAPSRPINVTGAGAVISGPCTFRGFYLASVAGGLVTIYDGTSAAGTVLAQFTLAANGDRGFDINDGARCELGIYVASAAALVGSVRVG